MTGSHEVRGSIPLGSTNHFNDLRRVDEALPLLVWDRSAGSAPNRLIHFQREPWVASEFARDSQAKTPRTLESPFWLQRLSVILCWQS